MYRDRKAGFIYGMDVRDLVAMSIYDVNTASYYVDSGTRNGGIWPFTELPFYAGPGRVLCSCLGSEDTFDSFSCYAEKYLKHNQIGEIVLTSLAKPQGMLLRSDADLKLK